jgi:hypothetical protein
MTSSPNQTGPDTSHKCDVTDGIHEDQMSNSGECARTITLRRHLQIYSPYMQTYNHSSHRYNKPKIKSNYSVICMLQLVIFHLVALNKYLNIKYRHFITEAVYKVDRTENMNMNSEQVRILNQATVTYFKVL